MLALRTSSFVSVQHLLRGRSVIVVTIVKVIEPGARRDKQVGESGTAVTVREEVKTPAVEGQSRASLETCSIDDWPQIHRGPPWIRRARSRRNPYVAARETCRRVHDAAGAIRDEEHLEPVSSDGWLFVVERRVEFRNGDSRGERPIFVECTGEEITGIRPRPDRVEVKGEGLGRGILKGHWAQFLPVRVDPTAEIDRRLPTQGIPSVNPL